MMERMKSKVKLSNVEVVDFLHLQTTVAWFSFGVAFDVLAAPFDINRKSNQILQ